MIAACIGEPVSWPRLERFAMGALDAPGAAEIESHVATCEACRACLDEIRTDVVALPGLPELPARAPSRWTRWLYAGGGAAALAAAAIALVVVSSGPTAQLADATPGPRVAVKGAGAVVLSIVRDRGGAIAFDPPGFRAGDRFKARVTCDPGARIFADVVVYQATAPGGAAAPSFPSLVADEIPCGNNVTLAGAFTITGAEPALVCVALNVGGAPPRTAAAHGPHSAGHFACAALAPE